MPEYVSAPKVIKRNLKDSLFTFLFRDIRYLRSLYASLHDDEQEYADEDFQIITLENIMVNNVYNDLGILIKDRLIILVEAQSTYNPKLSVFT